MNTINETEKLLAAMDVTETGILTKCKFSDIDRVKAILPNHYKIEKSKAPNAIHCVSTIGIKKGVDAEDDEHWECIMKAIKKYFGKRFKEVDHNVCFCHKDFTIYLSEVQ